MAKASKEKSNPTIDDIEHDALDTVGIEEPTTVGLDADSDIDFVLDTTDLEARIAEVSDDIMSGSTETAQASLPSERVAAAAESWDDASIETQALPLPANDEHNSEINNLLYAISNKPSSYVFTLATLFTLVWLAACAYVGYNTVYDTLPSTFDVPTIITNQPLLIFGAFVLISLIVIWSCAILVKRSHDMKYSTNLMLSAAKQLLQPESVAIDSVTSVGTAVRREVAAIGEGVERAIARAGELEYMIQNEVMNIERSYGDSETRLRSLVNEISTEREEIVTHADKLQEAISKTHTNLASELEITTTRIDDAVRASTSAQTKEMSDSVVSAGQVVAKLLETRTASFQKASAALETKLAEGNQALEQSIDTKTSDLSTVLANAGQSVSSIINSGSASISEESNQMIQALEQSIDTKTSDLSTVLANAGQSVSSIINSGSASISEKSNQMIQAFDVVQQKMVDEFVRQGDTTTKNLEDSLSIRASEFSERVAESGEIIQTSIIDKLSQMNSSMTMVGEKLVSSLGMRAEELDTLLSSKSSEIDTLLASKNSEIDNTLDSRLSGFNEALTGHVDTSIGKLKTSTATLLENTKQAEEIIQLRSQSVEETLKKSTIEFTENVGKNIQAIESSSSAMDEKLSAASEQIKSTITGGTEELGNLMSSNSGILQEQFTEKTETLAGILNNSLDAVEKQFNAGGEILEANLEKGKTELLGTISKAIADSSKVIDDSTEGLSSTLSERIGEMNSKLDHKTAQFNRLLSERANELTNILDEKASPIASELESVSAVISERLTGISDTVSTNTTTLFNNLGDTKDVLENLTEQTAINLTSMRTQVMEQANNFAQLIADSQEAMSTSTAISENVQAKLQTTSTNLLEGMQDVVGRVEMQGHNLQEATQLIDKSQSNFEATVDSKQVTLKELANLVTQRSEQLNENVNAFGNVITTLVEKVAHTSQDLGGTVSTDISNAIDEATSRFNETVSAMRNAAYEMRNELEETREEMRRGVLELPEETSHSANAMRRVVTDQLSAMKDLTRIIEESGQLLDSKPSFQTQVQAPQPVTEATAPQPASPPPSRLPKAVPKPQPRAFKPLPAARPNNSTQERIPLRAPQVQSRPTSSEIPVEEGNGWVSDLLRRASQEPEQERSSGVTRRPRSGPPSLKNLSADIPNAIDDVVISDLWNRYRDGENDLFSRDIYNLNGQHLFDQIARNYAQNNELKSGIDSYIADFEERLSQATEQGTSDQAIQNYLTSDQGKIYTMFAHAAGRYN